MSLAPSSVYLSPPESPNSLSMIDLTLGSDYSKYDLKHQMKNTLDYIFKRGKRQETIKLRCKRATLKNNNHKMVFKTNYPFMQLKNIAECSKGHSQKDQKLVFKTNYCLMQVKSIAECSKGSILQYFRPSLSYHLSLRSLFCLFLSGHFYTGFTVV